MSKVLCRPVSGDGGHASIDDEADTEPPVTTSGEAVLSSKLSGDTLILVR
jgi:hypothetical protein